MNRSFEMMYLLMQKRNITAAELAKHFEVSTRTIYRDLDELSAAGIPVYTTKGRGGGIHILDNFILDKSLLSEEEQNEILFALQSIKAMKASNEEFISERLAGLFQKSSTNWIDIDFSHWGSSSKDKEKFLQLKKAILNKHIVQFLYYNSQGETSFRKVEPSKLFFKGSDWYLQAYCLDKDSYRTFKVVRMDEILILDETFQFREEPLPNIPNEWDNGEYEEYQLLFSKKVSYRVYDEFSKQQIIRNEDGSLFVQVKFMKGDWIMGHLLSYGEGVTIISPTSEREKLCNMALKIAEKYK